jgi:hypothetical protein
MCGIGLEMTWCLIPVVGVKTVELGCCAMRSLSKTRQCRENYINIAKKLRRAKGK